MNTEKPTLYATLTREKETRHLLIYSVDGARETKLTQLIAAVETPIATGTQHEMQQLAASVAQSWIADQGFKRPPENQPVFEPLDRTIPLATKMGFTVIYDPRFKSMSAPPFNPTGAVSLSTWPGMTPKNGGGYEYALVNVTLHARPTLPPSHEPLVAPTDGKEFAAFMLSMSTSLDAVGPAVEFLLAD
jgi:hypothetical protein